MQRGIQSTMEIIDCVLDGLTLAPSQKILVCDMLVNRFNEWGLACWKKQVPRLSNASDTKPDVHFMGFILQDDKPDNILLKVPNTWHGQAMTEWWDSSSEAGAKTRPRTPFAEQRPTLEILTLDGKMIPQVVQAEYLADPSVLSPLQQQVKAWNDARSTAAGAPSSPVVAAGSSSRTGSTPADNRTNCRPIFGDDEMPISTGKTFEFSEDCIVPMDSLTESLGCKDLSCAWSVNTCSTCFDVVLLNQDTVWLVGARLSGCCQSTCNASVWCYATADGKLYLVNKSDQPLTLPAGELFGFGSGAFEEKVTGVAKLLNNDWIPWLLASDGDLVLYQDSAGQKKPLPLAEVFCILAQKEGIMNISTVDYSMRQKVTPEGESLHFRYEVVSKTKVNCFVPKTVEFADPMNIKASSFGTVFNGKLTAVPRSIHAKILWEEAMRAAAAAAAKKKPEAAAPSKEPKSMDGAVDDAMDEEAGEEEVPAEEDATEDAE
eukprot:Skav224611  [mRNA]  locus=scaffold3477:158725:162577:- [translate_table: standard]